MFRQLFKNLKQERNIEIPEVMRDCFVGNGKIIKVYEGDDFQGYLSSNDSCECLLDNGKVVLSLWLITGKCRRKKRFEFSTQAEVDAVLDRMRVCFKKDRALML